VSKPIDRIVASLTEKEWDAQLFETKKGLATTLGWTLVYHTYRSTRSPSGFPDRVLVRDRVVFVELKAEDGRPTARQREWLTGLARAGAEAYLWRPSDLEEIGAVLAGRWRVERVERGIYLASPERLWVPGSMWIVANGAADRADAIRPDPARRLP